MTTLNQQIRAGGTVRIPAGEHHLFGLDVYNDTELIGEPGTVLYVDHGIYCQPTRGAVYAQVRLRNLKIVGAGHSTGLHIEGCKAVIENVSVHNYALGFDLTNAIECQTYNLSVENNANGGRIAGGQNCAIEFTSSLFHGATTGTAFEVDAMTTGVSFIECKFQTSKNGLHIKNAQSVRIVGGHFENIHERLLHVEHAGSVTVTNPYMTGNAANNLAIEAVLLDDVKYTSWDGGNCLTPKTVFLKTTVNTGRAKFDPGEVGGQIQVFDYLKFFGWRADGVVNVPALEWRYGETAVYRARATYNQTPGDFLLKDEVSGKVYIYWRPDGRIGLAGTAVSANGAEVKVNGELEADAWYMKNQDTGLMQRIELRNSGLVVI